MDVYIHVFLTSDQLEVSGQLYNPSTLPLGKNTFSPSDWGLDVPQSRCDDTEK
jgi:hypothetical protein